jgi:hypothetical protein
VARAGAGAGGRGRGRGCGRVRARARVRARVRDLQGEARVILRQQQPPCRPGRATARVCAVFAREGFSGNGSVKFAVKSNVSS